MRRERQRGAAMVEAAVVTAVLAAFFFGVVRLGAASLAGLEAARKRGLERVEASRGR